MVKDTSMVSDYDAVSLFNAEHFLMIYTETNSYRAFFPELNFKEIIKLIEYNCPM